MSWIFRPQSSSAPSAAREPSTSTLGPVPAFWNFVMSTPITYTSVIYLLSSRGPGLKEICKIRIAFPILPARVLYDDVDGHVELQIFRIGFNVDQITLEFSPAFDAGERAVHHRIRIQLALRAELVHRKLVARAAL